MENKLENARKLLIEHILDASCKTPKGALQINMSHADANIGWVIRPDGMALATGEYNYLSAGGEWNKTPFGSECRIEHLPLSDLATLAEHGEPLEDVGVWDNEAVQGWLNKGPLDETTILHLNDLRERVGDGGFSLFLAEDEVSLYALQATIESRGLTIGTGIGFESKEEFDSVRDIFYARLAAERPIINKSPKL